VLNINTTNLKTQVNSNKYGKDNIMDFVAISQISQSLAAIKKTKHAGIQNNFKSYSNWLANYRCFGLCNFSCNQVIFLNKKFKEQIKNFQFKLFWQKV